MMHAHMTGEEGGLGGMLWRLPMPRSHCWIAIACCGAGLAAGLQGPKAVGSGSAHVGSHLGCVVMGCVVMGSLRRPLQLFGVSELAWSPNLPEGPGWACAL